MKGFAQRSFGLRAISVFYLIGMIAVGLAFFGNRESTGIQLARIHGMPSLPVVLAIALTLVMGTLVIAALNYARPWGFWLVVGYMMFLIVVPAYSLGGDNVSLFANVFWPLIVIVYMWVKRREFSVGWSA